MAAADFLSRYLNGPLPFVRRHITINKMSWVCRQIKHFLPSFLQQPVICVYQTIIKHHYVLERSPGSHRFGARLSLTISLLGFHGSAASGCVCYTRVRDHRLPGTDCYI